MALLLIAEHNNKNLSELTPHALSAAIQLDSSIDLLIVGYDCENVITEAKNLPHIKNILVVNNKNYEHQLAENTAPLVAKLLSNYKFCIGIASTYSKNLLPRIAGILQVGMISDVIKIHSQDTFERPIYAGNAIATVQTSEPLKILSIRSTAFPKVELSSNIASVEVVNDVIENTLSQYVGQELSRSDRPELTAAKIIISGGRGLKNAENFKLLENIADKIGAAIGASRAAVDAGFAPNDYQVGQTGKVVAPDLYIAVGISGAIQHLAGMKDSKVIVAINNDPDAPIFQIADYGLVGDLFKILPELEEALNNK